MGNSTKLGLIRLGSAIGVVLAFAACSENATPVSGDDTGSSLPVVLEEVAESVPAPLAAPVRANFSGLSGWFAVDGAPLESGVDGGSLVVPAIGGYNYGDRISVTPGAKFSVAYQVTLPPAEAGAAPYQYVVGPLYRNAAGEVLSWGEVKSDAEGGQIDGVAEGIAPDFTATVQLYLGGLWSPNAPLPTASVVYSAAELTQVAP